MNKNEKMSLEIPAEVDPWSGLTDRQKFIQKLKLRDMSQTQIAKIVGISNTEVSRELKEIKEIHRMKGISLNKDDFIGQTVTVFQELEFKAWEILDKAGKGETPNVAVQIQCIQALATLQEKKAKLLMDVGLLEKTSTKHEHSFKATGPTIVDTWDVQGRAKLAEAIIVSQLKELPEPEEDEDMLAIEAEYEEVEKE